MQSETVGFLAAALSRAQGEFDAVPFNATNPFLKNRYADLGAVIETAKPVLARHGLAVAQFVVADGERVGVRTVLLHESGEWMDATITLPVGDEKGKSMAQVAGSVITYLRRYAYAAALGLYADEDEDGEHGPRQQPAQRQQQPRPAPAPTAAHAASDAEFDALPGASATVQAPDPARPQRGITAAQAAADLRAAPRPWNRQQVISALQGAVPQLVGEGPANGSWGACVDIMERIGVSERRAFLQRVFGVDSAKSLTEAQKWAVIRWAKPHKDDATGRWEPASPHFAAEFAAVVGDLA